MDFELTYERDRIPMDQVVAWLHTSYWAEHRPEAVVIASWDGSAVVAALLSAAGDVVAFARAVSDMAVVAYLADVFVVPEYRGHGLGKRIVGALVDHPDLRGLGWVLHTRDAHSLYRQFGFERPYPRLMERQPGAARTPPSASRLPVDRTIGPS